MGEDKEVRLWTRSSESTVDTSSGQAAHTSTPTTICPSYKKCSEDGSEFLHSKHFVPSEEYFTGSLTEICRWSVTYQNKLQLLAKIPMDIGEIRCLLSANFGDEEFLVSD